EHGEDVFDVRRLEEFQAAIFHKRDIAAGELRLEQGAGVGGAGEHRLGAGGGGLLTGFEDLVGDGTALLVFGFPSYVHGAGDAGADGPQVFREAFAGVGDDGVGDVENRAGGAIVLVEGDAAGTRELLGEIQDVAHGGGAEAVYGLRVVADHHQVADPFM